MQNLLCAAIKLIHSRPIPTQTQPHIVFSFLSRFSLELRCNPLQNASHTFHLCIVRRPPRPQHNGSRQEYKIMEICTSSCTRNRHAYLLFSYWTWFCPAKRSSKSQQKLGFRVRSCSRSSSSSSRSSSKFIFHAIKSEIKANNSLKCELITFDICFKFKLCLDRLQQHHHPASSVQDNEILIGKYALLHFTSGYYPWQILFISNSCGRCLAPNSSGNVDALGITVMSAKTSFAILRIPQIDINRYICLVSSITI